MSNKQTLSLEFFPPRDIAAQEKLVRTAKSLMGLNPAYVSMTFGAGGSTRAGTVDAVALLQKLGFGRLPGDFRFRLFGRERFIPLTTTLILSGLASLIAKLL